MHSFELPKKETAQVPSQAETEAYVKSREKLGENVRLSFLENGGRELSPVENALAMIEARIWEGSLSMNDREGGKKKSEEYTFLTGQYLKQFGKEYEPIITSQEKAEEFLNKYFKREDRKFTPAKEEHKEVPLEQKKKRPEEVFEEAA